MRREVILALAAILLLPLAGAANASSKAKFAPEFGTTLPPIGFVRFCGVHPVDCDHQSNTGRRISFNGENWAKLVDINAYVNHRIRPESDQQLYGEPEYWTYPVDAGDCEDYLLLKKRYLESMGFAPDSLLITVVLDEHKDGHAVLMAVTDDGDYVLDNRRNDILRWNETGYSFVKRQSALNARQWVTLEKQKSRSGSLVASGSQR
jgi:predicted transglutaminase-like cysteine proteinase